MYRPNELNILKDWNIQNVRDILNCLDMTEGELMELRDNSESQEFLDKSLVVVRYSDNSNSQKYHEFRLYSEELDKLNYFVRRSEFSEHSVLYNLYINSEFYDLYLNMKDSCDFEDFIDEVKF